jgi:putative RNA 2'-phosphotransferase
MSDKQLVRLSKWISLRLRHDPAGIGLAVDSAGWAAVEDLIAASARRGVRFDRAALQILSVDAAAMAAHGHTFRVTGNGVWLTATVPPQYLHEPAA